ncbi:unnamed protein product [Mytilus edulis]|uniref:Uncharacterized protein n=1 Tax=Mytilus edulis TaxID=6550 RepID=A0A8S3R1U1_MYTED|nr:unnamed protein product [Mytilus edulis]
MNCDTRLFSSRTVLNRGYQENVLDEYQNAWDVSLPINNKNLRSCEQKLIKLDKKELEYLLKQHFSNHTDNCKFDYLVIHLLSLNCTCDCFGIKEIHEHRICVLLHLIHVFCIPGQDDKIKLVQVILNELLQMLAEGEIYRVFKRYLSQQLKVKSSLTEIDLLAGKDTSIQ